MANMVITLKSDGRPTLTEPGRLNAFYGDAVVGYVVTPTRGVEADARAFLLDGDVEVGSFKNPQATRTPILHAYLASIGQPLPRRGRPVGSIKKIAVATAETPEAAVVTAVEGEIVSAE